MNITKKLRHPALPNPDKLTFGDRSADVVRNAMGSWPFVFGFIFIMALWAFANSVLHLWSAPGKAGFDPYPYILLNLMLSTMAGLQGAILLIAAKREDKISSDLANHDYQVNLHVQQLLEENTKLTRAIDELTREIHGAIIPKS